MSVFARPGQIRVSDKLNGTEGVSYSFEYQKVLQ